MACWIPDRAVRVLGHCVVFLGKTLYSRGASLHPGLTGTRVFNSGVNSVMD